MTAVLHAHTRRLDYHPHVHVVVPGGGINKRRRQWRALRGKAKYLFHHKSLAKVFRARLVQQVLGIHIAYAALTPRARPVFRCCRCQQPLRIAGFIPRPNRSG